jgi:hypothetical protein
MLSPREREIGGRGREEVGGGKVAEAEAVPMAERIGK